MSLRGYKPKWKKAPWVGMKISGRQSAQAVTPATFRATAKPTPLKGLSSAGLFKKGPQARETARRKRRAGSAWTKLSRRLVAEANGRGERCPVVNGVPGLKAAEKYGHSVSDRIDQVHHVFGRGHGGRGPLLLDERLLMPTGKQGHRWIDANRDEARRRGWLAPVGHYNVPVPSDAVVTRNEWGGVSVTLASGEKIC